MPGTHNQSLDKHRHRLREQGFSRLEVVVPSSDKPLLREVARRLRGAPEEAATTRRQLTKLARGDAEVSLKALLASAPLENIDLRRDRDSGREVEL